VDVSDKNFSENLNESFHIRLSYGLYQNIAVFWYRMSHLYTYISYEISTYLIMYMHIIMYLIGVGR